VVPVNALHALRYFCQAAVLTALAAAHYRIFLDVRGIWTLSSLWTLFADCLSLPTLNSAPLRY